MNEEQTANIGVNLVMNRRRSMKLVLPVLYLAATAWPSIVAYRTRTADMRIWKYQKAHSGIVWYWSALDRFGPPTLQEQLFFSLSLPAMVAVAPIGKIDQRNLNGPWPHALSHSQLIVTIIFMCVLWWCVGWLWEQGRASPMALTGLRQALRVTLRIILAVFSLTALAGFLFLLVYERDDLIAKLPTFLIFLAWTGLAFFLLRRNGRVKQEAASVESDS